MFWQEWHAHWNLSSPDLPRFRFPRTLPDCLCSAAVLLLPVVGLQPGLAAVFANWDHAVLADL
jgi:hypothetical protein